MIKEKHCRFWNLKIYIALYWMSLCFVLLVGKKQNNLKTPPWALDFLKVFSDILQSKWWIEKKYLSKNAKTWMQSDGQTQTQTNTTVYKSSIYWYSRANTQTHMPVNLQLYQVSDYWPVSTALSCISLGHSSTAEARPEERRFPNIWWIAFQEEIKKIKTVVLSVEALSVCVCPGV